jgi:hypothetical protein
MRTACCTIRNTVTYLRPMQISLWPTDYTSREMQQELAQQYTQAGYCLPLASRPGWQDMPSTSGTQRAEPASVLLLCMVVLLLVVTVLSKT